jgi:leucyl aminopeptidase
VALATKRCISRAESGEFNASCSSASAARRIVRGRLRRAGAIGRPSGESARRRKLAFFAGPLTGRRGGSRGARPRGRIEGTLKNSKTARPTDEQRAPLTDATILADGAAAEAGVRAARAIAEGHALARRLGMLPGNVCTPDYLADTARDIAKRLGMVVTTLGREAMAREKMGSFLSVAQGTSQDPKLIALEYRRGPKDAPPVALVGKGLCFDSGGISIKPAQGMEWMKFDMCGAAGVLGAMEAIGRLELPINVVGLIGSTTNMPSGEAGEAGRRCAGVEREVHRDHQHRRGRSGSFLPTCWRSPSVFSPAAVVDAATLTGACVIALGPHGDRRDGQ